MALIDSYSELNQDGFFNIGLTINGGGQAITLAAGATLTSCKFNLRKVGSPTGNMVAKLYAVTGTVGTDGKPTGAPLATSANLDVSTIATNFTLYEFTFGVPYEAGAQDICVVIEYGAGSAGNYIDLGVNQSPGGHAGNTCYFTTSWATIAYDTCFYLYGTPDVVAGNPLFFGSNF